MTNVEFDGAVSGGAVSGDAEASETGSSGLGSSGLGSSGLGSSGAVASGAERAIRRPRIRFGTISWGLIVGLGGTALLWLLVTPGARSELVQWVLDLEPGIAILLAVVAAGAILLLLGVLALIRQRQVRAEG